MLNEQRDRNDAYDGPIDLPDEHDGSTEEAAPAASLTDDVVALIDDGKTYVEAELAFQKSRAAYVASQSKRAIVLGFGAFGVLHLALIAATVGAVLALLPIVGPWAATGIVTVVLVVIGVLLVLLLRSRLSRISQAFSGSEK